MKDPESVSRWKNIFFGDLSVHCNYDERQRFDRLARAQHRLKSGLP